MPNNLRVVSTQALNDILRDIINNPETWIENKELMTVLKSQSKLAKWENVELKIIGCSLNTLKSCANKLLSDGFDGMDLRRNNALLAIEREVTKKLLPKPGSRGALEAKVKIQVTQIKALKARNMLLCYHIIELQSLTEDAISSCSSKEVIIRNQRKLSVIHSKLSAYSENDLI